MMIGIGIQWTQTRMTKIKKIFKKQIKSGIKIRKQNKKCFFLQRISLKSETKKGVISTLLVKLKNTTAGVRG